jgi:O-antigen ligase
MSNEIGKSYPRWRLSKVFFYIFLVILPFQTRKIFFGVDSFYHGYNVFYNTYYLYLTDLIFLCVILPWLWESWKKHKQIVQTMASDKIYWFLGAFWLILATSLMFSREIFLGFYGFVKITEFILLFAYVRESFFLDREFSREILRFFWLILGTSLFQGILGIFQYLRQSSFGLKFLGEEFLRPGLTGLAQFPSHMIANPVFFRLIPYLSAISAKSLNMRAYGTFPHPNVLAGLLFTALIVNLSCLYFSREKLFLSLSLIIISTGLVVTFSRFAWGVAALGIVGWFVWVMTRLGREKMDQVKLGTNQKKEVPYFPGRVAWILLILLFSLGLNWSLFGMQIKDRLGVNHEAWQQNYPNDESITDRIFYGKIAERMIVANPVWGVGVKNFVVEMQNYVPQRLLPYLHQPVHNIFLLIAAESGVLALIVFIIFLYYIVRHASANLAEPIYRYPLFIIFFGFLILGSVDHYLWTIQQGSLLFWIVLALMSLKKEFVLGQSSDAPPSPQI